MDETTPLTDAQKPGSLGPIMATIIIVALFVVGGVYFLIKQGEHNKALKLQNEQMQLPANS
jgi:hypothetical protein